MERANNLIFLIQQYNLRYGCELGTHNGDLLFTVLDRCSNIKMIGVDIWSCQDVAIYSDYDYMTCEDWDTMYNGVIDKSKKYGNRVLILKMLTSKASGLIQDNSLDFIFIDANHSYDAVKQDIKLWVPKVKHSGLITGHDIGFDGVDRATREAFGVVNKLGEIWYVYRDKYKR